MPWLWDHHHIENRTFSLPHNISSPTPSLATTPAVSSVLCLDSNESTCQKSWNFLENTVNHELLQDPSCSLFFPLTNSADLLSCSLVQVGNLYHDRIQKVLTHWVSRLCHRL